MRVAARFVFRRPGRNRDRLATSALRRAQLAASVSSAPRLCCVRRHATWEARLMTATQLFRLSGLALFVGALLGIASSVISGVLFPDTSDPVVAANPFNMLLTAIGVIGGILALFGLPGLYLNRASRGGVTWF